MTDRELMQQALEALEADEYDMVPDQEGHMVFRKESAITAMRERLAQPEQKPMTLPCCGYADTSAIKFNKYNGVVQCHNCGQTYVAPPRREWQGLTDEECQSIYDTGRGPAVMMEMVEAKLKEKNT